MAFDSGFWNDLVNNEEFQMLFKILLAASLGYIIGYERKSKSKPVGSRTCILILVSSALLTILSTEGFSKFLGEGEFADPSRMAGQILVGIGFIGAGVIMHNTKDNLIVGVTTAFSVWALSAVGIAIGLGEYSLAVVTSLVLVGVLRIPKKLNDEKK